MTVHLRRALGWAGVFLFILLTWPSAAQDSEPPGWSTLKPSESGLVLILSGVEVTSVKLMDNRKELDSVKWPVEWPAMWADTVKLTGKETWKALKTDWPYVGFIRQYRLPPGTYDIRFHSIIQSVRLDLRPAKITTVRIESGDRISWVMASTDLDLPDVLHVFRLTKKFGIGELLKPKAIAPAGKTISISTEPPWPIPPKPGKDPSEKTGR